MANPTPQNTSIFDVLLTGVTPRRGNLHLLSAIPHSLAPSHCEASLERGCLGVCPLGLIYGDFCPGRSQIFNFPLHRSEQFPGIFSTGAGSVDPAPVFILSRDCFVPEHKETAVLPGGTRLKKGGEYHVVLIVFAISNWTPISTTALDGNYSEENSKLSDKNQN